MRARVGDRIVVKGHRVGEPDRDAEILEVHGESGGPPFVERWSDDGHEGLFFPGPDATVQHFGAEPESDSYPDLGRRENELEEIALDECLDFLEGRRVGRVAFVKDEAPVVVPVNYCLVREHGLNWIAFRTRLGGDMERTSLFVAFEIDEVDDEARRGWSVLVRGSLHPVDPDAADFRRRFDSAPWVADRDAWMVIKPFSIEGRRLTAPEGRAPRRRDR